MHCLSESGRAWLSFFLSLTFDLCSCILSVWVFRSLISVCVTMGCYELSFASFLLSSLSFSLSFSHSVCLYACLSVCLCVNQPVWQCVSNGPQQMSVYCPSFCPSVCLLVCLSASHSACMFCQCCSHAFSMYTWWRSKMMAIHDAEQIPISSWSEDDQGPLSVGLLRTIYERNRRRKETREEGGGGGGQALISINFRHC